MTDLTPVNYDDMTGIWLKRDDQYVAPGDARGGKARTCYAIARTATRGLVTAGSRASPQASIVARIGAALGLPVRVHTPSGTPGPEVVDAIEHGADHVQHFPGYNTVLVARARSDADARGWTEVPFGMETPVAVTETAVQVANIPDDARRVVVPVGSGMSLAGIVTGLRAAGRYTPVLGVAVGADPTRRLDQYAPGWRGDTLDGGPPVTLVPAGCSYDHKVTGADGAPLQIGGAPLDPIYEAKVVRHLCAGDVFWVVGLRPSLNTEPQMVTQ